MKACVTGATGLLGSNLCEQLFSVGWDVSAARRESSRTDHLRHLPIRWITADVEDQDSLTRAFDGADVVFHCAAAVGYGRALEKVMPRINVAGTRNVIEAVKLAGVKRLVHCSSVDALGLPEDEIPSTEASVWNWDKLGVDFPYPRSKYESEKLVLQAACGEIDAVIVNPAFLIGPMDSKPSSGRLILAAAAGTPFYLSGENNFVDARDAAIGMLLAAERGARGERYILGGRNMTYSAFMKIVRAYAGVRRPLIRAPYFAAHAFGRICELVSALSGKELEFNTRLAKLGTLRHTFSSDKAARELGYSPGCIEKAVADCLDWFYAQARIAIPVTSSFGSSDQGLQYP